MNRLKNILETIPDQQLASYLQSAAKAALAGGKIVKDLFNQPHSITMKGEIDLVTEADPASETAILNILSADFPDIPNMAEESAKSKEMPQQPTWVVDPLDGTTNYAHGFPVFGVSVALMQRETSLVGVVYCPMADELFCAAQGAGAWLNDKPINTTSTSELIESLVATGFPYEIHTHLDCVMEQLRKVLPAVRDVRRAGAAAVDLAYTACGRLDGFWEMDLKPWDTAAGRLLVEEAGGITSDFNGQAYSPFKAEIIAANPAIHQKLRSLIA